MSPPTPNERVKVLIADDDRMTRTVLCHVLSECNYEPVCAEDGATALAKLIAPGAPYIALVDWDMPLINGPELCARLRKQQLAIDPWLTILTARNDKKDVVFALDAGANDFCSKPPSKIELQARLRVAERIMTQQLVKNYTIATLQKSLTDARLNVPAISPQDPPTRPAKVCDLAAFHSAQIDTIVAAALRNSGQTGSITRIEKTAAKPAVAWTSFILSKQQEWVDVLVEVSAADAEVLFRQANNRSANDSADYSHYLSQIYSSIRNSFLSVLSKLGEEVIVPAVGFSCDPKWATPASELPAEFTTRYAYKSGQVTINVVVVRQPNARREKQAESLSIGDILAESYPPNFTERVPFVYASTVLDHRMVEKLREFIFESPLAQETDKLPVVVVHSPSSFSSHYIRASIQSARRTKLEAVG